MSAGFDAHVDDPLGSLRLTAETFGTMAGALGELRVPLAVVLEGGYGLTALEASVLQTLTRAQPRLRSARLWENVEFSR